MIRPLDDSELASMRTVVATVTAARAGDNDAWWQAMSGADDPLALATGLTGLLMTAMSTLDELGFDSDEWLRKTALVVEASGHT